MSNHIVQTQRTLRRLICLAAAALLPASAQTFQVLYHLPASFLGESSGQLAEVSPGLFYGAAQPGIFAVSSAGGQMVRTFAAGEGYPVGQVLEGLTGRLYGVALSGGGNGFGYVFRSDFNGSLTVLNSFASGTQYAFPLSAGYDFNLYGLSGSDPNIFYRVPLSGGFVVLHTFDASTEGIPAGPLARNSDGSFYGVAFTPYSTSSPGLIYRITTTGVYTPIYTFPSSVQRVGNSLLRAANGLFYGVTWGTGCSGTIYQITPAGVLTTLLSTGVCQPATLIQASDGNIYGADLLNPLPGGGSDPYGVIFRMTPGGAITPLHTFANSLTEGSAPASLVQGSDGKLYGVTSSGIGSVFSLDLGLPKPFPAVLYFYPASAKVGGAVVLSGYNLLAPISVSFNGVPATQFGSAGSSYIVALVPPGATSGPITVTTPGGSFKTAGSFTVQ